MDSEKTDSKKEAMRKKALGELGELVALKTLVDKGFEKISHLNDTKRRTFLLPIFSQRRMANTMR